MGRNFDERNLRMRVVGNIPDFIGWIVLNDYPKTGFIFLKNIPYFSLNSSKFAVISSNSKEINRDVI